MQVPLPDTYLVIQKKKSSALPDVFMDILRLNNRIVYPISLPSKNSQNYPLLKERKLVVITLHNIHMWETRKKDLLEYCQLSFRGNSQFIFVKTKNAFCKAKVPQNCQFYLKRIG
jgi:hypothetical protein